MIDFLALFGLVFALICVTLLITKQGIGSSGFVVIAVFAALIAEGLLRFGVVSR